MNAGPLPSVRWGLAAVSFNNRIFVTGKENILSCVTVVYIYLFYTGGAGAGEANFKVLEFLKSTKEWTPVGRLKRWRRWHGISVTDKDITKYCL